MAETLFEILNSVGHRLTRHDGQFGLEIETETNSPYNDPRMRNWHVVPDGSLRNFGREYVLAAPMSFGKGLEEALAEFGEIAKTIPFNQGSNSTSVHVHINMLNETVRTLANTITAYALMEPLLISACGEERRSNLFCLPFHDTGGTVHEVTNLLGAIEGNFARQVRNLNSDNLKYSGLNIAPLRNLGSIEVRTMEGTTDINRISQWVTTLGKIIEFGRTPDFSPVEIVSTYLGNKEGFLDRLGIDPSQFTGDIQSHLLKGREVAFDFASVFYDWERAFKTLDATTKKSSKKKSDELGANLDGLSRRVRPRADAAVDSTNPFGMAPGMGEDAANLFGTLQQGGESVATQRQPTIEPSPIPQPRTARRGRTVVADGMATPAEQSPDEFVEIFFEEEA